jgi:hypothetical protein
MSLLELLGRAWEALTRPIDSFLLGCAFALVGVGLVTLFSAADQSAARVTNQVVSLGLALASHPEASGRRPSKRAAAQSCATGDRSETCVMRLGADARVIRLQFPRNL